MYKTILTAMFLGLFLSRVLAGGNETEIDAAQVDAQKFKVLLENEYVRVLEYQVLPGEKDEWHTHPAKVSYVVSGGTLRITTASGESFEVDEAANSARWSKALGKHYAENIGNTPVRIVLVEVRGVR